MIREKVIIRAYLLVLVHTHAAVRAVLSAAAGKVKHLEVKHTKSFTNVPAPVLGNVSPSGGCFG